MIPNNAITRVFQLRFGANVGTGFVIDIDDRQYLITAKHLLEDWDRNEPCLIFHDKQWKQVIVSLVGNLDNETDIVVLAAGQVLVHPVLTLPATAAGLAVGQDVYFLGFPYTLRAEVDFKLNNGFPLPFLKKGIVSAMYFESGTHYIYLDGHNNPGFSGGPVIFTPPGTYDFKVAAVVSGFKSVWLPVYDGNVETAMTYEYNTGIVECHGMNQALPIIAANPIGASLLDYKKS